MNVVENIFWTNKKMFSCPPSITKTKIWRIGIRIFGGSDVVNKLLSVGSKKKNNKFHILNFYLIEYRVLSDTVLDKVYAMMVYFTLVPV